MDEVVIARYRVQYDKYLCSLAFYNSKVWGITKVFANIASNNRVVTNLLLPITIVYLIF